MSFVEGLTLVGLGATIFALILGVFLYVEWKNAKKRNYKSNYPFTGSNNKSSI